MIVVDTSVWIDYFNGAPAPQAGLLDGLLGERVLAVGDLILTELLQSFATERDASRALRLFEPLEFLEMAGRDLAIQAAANCRRLRRRGVTVRKTMDCSSASTARFTITGFCTTIVPSTCWPGAWD